jgi:Sec7 domain/PH domain
MQIQREEEPQLVYPDREETDTPASYLEKLAAAVPRGSMATILCKTPDEFSKTCLRKYMRGFSYFGDPIDIAVRKMLMEVELPKETQQIDRLLAGFSDRYFECNPGIYVSADETSIVAFSILLLHSDTHNKSNKRKMQRPEYVKNTQGPAQVSHEVLECFYDNVCYTPFIHFEDEVALNSHRLTAPKLKKSLIRTKSSESIRGPVDPYNLILDNKLDVLRPSLKEVMDTEDTYNSMGTASAFDANELHTAFTKAGVLQIVSARSRPDAFLTQATITNPAEAQMGLVSIKVAKVGLLWRKDPKKKKAKRPWQEWGAILTDSKLYFFKDVGWVRKLMVQYEEYNKSSTKRGTLVFKPPLPSFDPDALMSMDDAIALLDSSYKKHKNAFTFIKHGGFEEIFLANDHAEMNDWIAKLNYAATFRTAGVRMRGMMGTASDGDKAPITRKDSELSTKSHEPVPAEQSQTAHRRANDHQMAWEIMFYRRQIISEKISDAEEKLAATQRELDNLLRNARHLQILLPFQAKTRESLIMAAGRMSAKLKWTRVEMWRTKCHLDLLKMDLEQEGTTAFPVPFGRHGSTTTTPQKTTPLKIAGPTRTNTETSNATLSPTSSISHTRNPLQNIDHARTPEKSQLASEETPMGVSWRKSATTLETSHPLNGSPVLVEEKFAAKDEHNLESHTLRHQSSIVSSARSKPDSERYTTPTPGVEDEDTHSLKSGGVSGHDGPVTAGKRPDTSGSDRDRVGAMSAEPMPRDRGGSVRRSLHRTLRDSHHNSHQTLSHHRGKKSRESGSSFVISEDGRPMSPENQELKRGTGSFIVHGKKASVVTFGSEWQTMSNEDRMKLRSVAHAEYAKGEAVIDDGTASIVSGPSAIAEAAVVSDEEAPGPSKSQKVTAGSSEGNGGFLTPPESSAPRKMSSSTMSEWSSLRAPSPLRSTTSSVAQG